MDAVRDALDRAARSGLIPAASSALLAVSGGADSMALLYGAADVAGDSAWTLSVAHVHHGWRGREADRDLAFVADHARRLELPFAFRRCDARRTASELKLSPEAGARHVRYLALAEMARETGAQRIATAHQRDDAVESYLIARRRLGGIAGLAGPREIRDDGVVRPLLSVSRAEILSFLAERGLGFRRDASNGNLRLTRNRVRRELSTAGENAVGELVREVAHLAAERARLDEEYSTGVLPEIRMEAGVTIGDAESLARRTPDLQRLALERLASPFARPGRPPMTGREREQVRELLESGRDFRFEAGRRIRFERRGRDLRIGLRKPGFAFEVYDSSAETASNPETGDQVL